MSTPLLLFIIGVGWGAAAVFVLSLCMAAARGDRLAGSWSDESRARRDLYPTTGRATLAVVKNAPASGDALRGQTHREDTSNEHASS
jgi:hypothetical protein